MFVGPDCLFILLLASWLGCDILAHVLGSRVRFRRLGCKLAAVKRFGSVGASCKPVWYLAEISLIFRRIWLPSTICSFRSVSPMIIVIQLAYVLAIVFFSVSAICSKVSILVEAFLVLANITLILYQEH